MPLQNVSTTVPLIHIPQPLPYDLLQKDPTLAECEPQMGISLFEDTRLYMLIGGSFQKSFYFNK